MICDLELCTRCAACRNVCPINCITFINDCTGREYPYIDEGRCLNCNQCIRVCPNQVNVKKRQVEKCFAAWSNDEETRYKSASGGIASEMYKYAIDSGMCVAGTYLNEDHDVYIKATDKKDDIHFFRNSKYTFSYMDNLYNEVDKILPYKKLLFIGLPCQCAGLINYISIKGFNRENIVIVDLICHGVPPAIYLKQHVAYIEKKFNRFNSTVQFRDPDFPTDSFVFSLTDSSKRKYYYKKVYEDDVYQLGYHKALIYGENCYHCPYASEARVSDITLGDFVSVGRCGEYMYDSHNTSCVLINSLLGNDFWEKLTAKKNITYLERDKREALDYEKQLSHPSIKHRNRELFIRKLQNGCSFSVAARDALVLDILWNRINFFLPLKKVKRIIKHIFLRRDR